MEGGRLDLRTTSFGEKSKLGSVLSPVIYNYELSAMLAAAGPATAAFLLAGGTRWRFFALAIAYAAGFLFFRSFVFKKRFLTLTIDRDAGEGLLKMPFRGEKKFRTAEIEKVEAEHAVITPENLDGLRQVEKIALHHHTVLPELDKPADIYTVRLWLKEGRPPLEIYSGRDGKSAAEAALNIRNFIFPESVTEDKK